MFVYYYLFVQTLVKKASGNSALSLNIISRSHILKMNSDYLTRSDVIYIYSYCDKCVGIICFYKILSIQIK